MTPNTNNTALYPCPSLCGYTEIVVVSWKAQNPKTDNIELNCQLTHKEGIHKRNKISLWQDHQG